MGRKSKVDRVVGKILLFKEIFGTPKGKECLYALMKHINYYSTSYHSNDSIHDCVFREGEKNVINLILQTIKQDPNKVLEEFRNMEQKELEYE